MKSLIPAGAALSLLALTGCQTSPNEPELTQRRQLEASSRALLAGTEMAPLTAETPPGEWLRHALMRNPEVPAAYGAWAEAVHRIPAARTPPDPRLTVELDIRRVVEMVMPGLMAEFPGPGKLSIAGDIASAESETARQKFRAAVLKTAFDWRAAAWSLRARSAKLALLRDDLRLLRADREAALARNAAGKGGLRDPLQAETEIASLEVKIANLEDSRDMLLARLAQAVGERAVPEPRLAPPSPPMNTDTDRRLDEALAANPALGALRADIVRTESELALAHRANLPDFSFTAMSDVRRGWSRNSYTEVTAGITLPVWRERIRENIAAAEASLAATNERRRATLLALAADFATARFTAREADRRLRLIDERLLPLATALLRASRADYAAGSGSLADPLDAARNLLSLRLEREDLLLLRDMALAEADLILAVPPPGSPSIEEPKKSTP